MMTTKRPTKAEAKRARTEAARAAAAQAKRRARNTRIGLWSAAAVVVLAVVVSVSVALGHTSKAGPDAANSGSSPTPTAGAQGRVTNPPWSAPADVSAAVAAAGLSMLGEEGTALHIHAHLDVIINGAPVQVPADIGVDDAQHKISALHSHDDTGVIHIESPNANDTFTLGQFFTEWQVFLSADRIGGLVTDNTHHLKVYVNGTPRTGDPTRIVLAAHDEIAIVYGTDAQQTNVPSTFQWTNGL